MVVKRTRRVNDFFARKPKLPAAPEPPALRNATADETSASSPVELAPADIQPSVSTITGNLGASAEPACHLCLYIEYRRRVVHGGRSPMSALATPVEPSFDIQIPSEPDSARAYPRDNACRDR